MTTYYPPLPDHALKDRSEWTRRDYFESEVDSYCQYHVLTRYRSREWVEFTERFVAYYEEWNGCWVAQEAWQEFTLYLRHPEGSYEPRDYPQGCSFHPSVLRDIP